MVVLFYLLQIFVFVTVSGQQIFDVTLDTQGSYKLFWTVDYAKSTIRFEVHLLKPWNLFAIGFSDRGHLVSADYCVLWKNWNDQVHFDDTNVDSFGQLFRDKKQNCLDFQIQIAKTVTKFTFSRRFDTCDPEDFVIKDGTVHLVWVKANHRLYTLNAFKISEQKEHGMVRVQLLKAIQAPRILNETGEDSFHLDILNDRVKVPNQETTYWCRVFKLPEKFREKHHIIQFGSNIEKSNAGIVHHIEVFHCYTDTMTNISLYDGSCFDPKRPKETAVCKRVLAAWAMGAKPLIYPKDTGLPFGGPNFNPYIMLEVHYNNPDLKSNLVDSSGIRFYLTKKLRSSDAGVMELGIEYTDKMAIPPYQQQFKLSGYCVAECTSLGLPASGITVFASQLHTHLTGVKVLTRHIRDGTELNELNRDDSFSTHFQEIRPLKNPVKILPGDALVTTCTYNTEDRENVTLGGFAISDEMCVNYIHYYPVIQLEVCKSSISDQALQSYFEYMAKWQYQKTGKEKPISENYKTIEWTPMRIEQLQLIYRESPLSMQCNSSNGDRLPGYWENTPVSAIKKPLPLPQRYCNTF